MLSFTFKARLTAIATSPRLLRSQYPHNSLRKLHSLNNTSIPLLTSKWILDKWDANSLTPPTAVELGALPRSKNNHFEAAVEARFSSSAGTGVKIFDAPKDGVTDVKASEVLNDSIDIVMFKNSFHYYCTPRTYMECRRVFKKNEKGVLVLSWEGEKDYEQGQVSKVDLDMRWKEVWVDFLGQYYGSLDFFEEEVDGRVWKTWLTKCIF